MSNGVHRSKVNGNPFIPLTAPLRAGVISTFVLCAGLVGVFSYAKSYPGHELVYLAFICYLLVLALPILFCKRNNLGVFHPVVFYILWTGLRSVVQGKSVLAASGLDYHRVLAGLSGYELNSIVATSLLLEVLAVVGLYLGYWGMPRIRVPNIKPFRPAGMIWKVAAWIGLSLAAFVILSQMLGGMDQMLLQRAMRADERISAEIGAHWHFVVSMGIIAPLIWLAHKPSIIRTVSFWAAILVCLAMLFFATGSRSSVIAPLMFIGTIWALRSRKIPYLAIAVGVVVSLLLLGLLGEVRIGARGVDSAYDIRYQGTVLDSIQAGVDEFASRAGQNSGQLGVVGKVPDRVGYLYGESYLSMPFVFIPAALWPWPTPRAGGQLVIERIYGREVGGVPPGEVGEAFWSFSYPGPILVFMVYGACLRIFASVYKKNDSNAVVVVMFVYVLFSFSPSSNAFYNFVHAVVPVLGFGMFAQLRAPRILRRKVVASTLA